jgi:hypothetical protein
MSEKKMDIDYGMQVFKLEETIVCQNHHNFKYILVVEKNKLNKIDIVGFFSQREN